ncbi:MAG: acyltransferase [Clostridiales bacterium]|nr:acyltransferase [Clostridiales bacterium]
MFLFVILLILLIAEKIGWKKPDFITEGGYLGKVYTNQLRGLFAIIVVYYHLALGIHPDGIFNIFSNLGNYSVGVFFFLSGYGLLVQYQKKGRDYLKGFLWHRVIVSLVIPYLIFNVIYYVAYVCLGRQTTPLDMLASWINGHPLVSNSWYIIAIFYFYLVFFVSALLSGKRLWLTTGLCFVGSLAWMVICHEMGYGDWWFYSCFTLNAGMLWVLVHERVEDWFQKQFWIKEAGALVACIVLYYAATILPQYIGMQTLIYLGCMQMSAIMFCVFVIALGMRIRFNGRCLALLGECSLELYLIHGLFMTIFRSDKLYLESDILYSLAVLLAAVLAAFLLHKGLTILKRRLAH